MNCEKLYVRLLTRMIIHLSMVPLSAGSLDTMSVPVLPLSSLTHMFDPFASVLYVGALALLGKRVKQKYKSNSQKY